ncbi:MAG: glycosyltransferase family 4 protein [Patescibacteria group bacterium]|nr:glycosyltransferase family 4 protein [Patescibacteria group bacterium]
MKILFFHRWVGVHLGGTETHVRELAELLCQRGHKVSILTREGEYPKNLDEKIKIYRISKNILESDHSYESALPLYFHTGLFMLKSFLYLFYLRFIRGEKFDVISVHFATESLVCRIFRFITGTPYVFVLEGYTKLEADVAKSANAVIAISRHEVDETLKRHGYEPLYIPKGRQKIFNASVDGSQMRQKFLGDADKIIIAVGRIEPRKDYPSLILTAERLKRKGKKYRWLIAGDGIDFQKIRKQIDDRAMTEEILMLGPVNNADLPFFYRAADLFFLPTLYEGFGYVFVEAMACGLPVVSTTAGSVPEVVGEAGILVEPKDIDGFAYAIETLLEQNSIYNSARSKALEIASFYDWDRLILEYEKVYLEAGNKKDD